MHLIADEQCDDVGPRLEGLELLEPVLEARERVARADVVHDDGALRAAVVRWGESAKSFLAGRVLRADSGWGESTSPGTSRSDGRTQRASFTRELSTESAATLKSTPARTCSQCYLNTSPQQSARIAQ